MSDNANLPKTANRLDSYRNFKFRIKWDGRYVAGVSKVSGLLQGTPAITLRGGGGLTLPKNLPGQSKFVPITLERGVTQDVAFYQWAMRVWDTKMTAADDTQGDTSRQLQTLEDFRKDITLEVYNEAGQKVLAYNLFRCWPSELTAVPDLSGTGHSIMIESLTLQNEGWQRDAQGEES